MRQRRPTRPPPAPGGDASLLFLLVLFLGLGGWFRFGTLFWRRFPAGLAKGLFPVGPEGRRRSRPYDWSTHERFSFSLCLQVGIPGLILIPRRRSCQVAAGRLRGLCPV